MATTGKRTGLRIRGARGHPVVRRALVRYAGWLRSRMEFPIRVPVYLSPGQRITTIHGEEATASFFAPWDRNAEPYIRIATGDYPVIRRTRSHDDALAAYICSMSHEVIHYRQWLETGDVWERGVIRQARRLFESYRNAVRRP